jgi:hypothetical protein
MAKTRRLRSKQKQQQQVGEGGILDMFRKTPEPKTTGPKLISGVNPENTIKNIQENFDYIIFYATADDVEYHKQISIVEIFNYYLKLVKTYIDNHELEIRSNLKDNSGIINHLKQLVDNLNDLADYHLREPVSLDSIQSYFEFAYEVLSYMYTQIQDNRIKNLLIILDKNKEKYNMGSLNLPVEITEETNRNNEYNKLSRLEKMKSRAEGLAKGAVGVVKGVGNLGKAGIMGLVRAGGFSRKTRSKKSHSKKTRKHRHR